MEEIGIIIPAYNPDEKLVNLVKNLIEIGIQTIIVVNDGSNPKCEKYFHQLPKQCIILKNEINQGKGNSLKKAFHYANSLKIKAVLTVDADGQHLIEDIKKMIQKFKSNPENIILGQRNFQEKGIPLSNKLGNKIASIVLKICTGYDLQDTQTGLRMIPKKYLLEMSSIQGERYEYEINMLLYIIKKQIKIEQVPIHTIYLEKQSSHFKKRKDSIKIIETIVKSKKSNRP